MSSRATGPEFFAVHQAFPEEHISDVPRAVLAGLDQLGLGEKVRPGQTVAVAVASRGTHDLREIVLTTIARLREMRLNPFVFPAMGSHGGGTPEGQAQVLRNLGISEEVTGVPIVSSMDVTSLGRIDVGGTGPGPEVVFSSDALRADHIVIINRVKPHTVFQSDVESGLCKMLAVGCGKQTGAAAMHRHDLARTIVPAAELILKKVPVLCGIAVTETASGNTHELRATVPKDFARTDRELLQSAYRLLPRLPPTQLDYLIVDEMGKNISGPGMDTNVIGFWRRDGGVREPDYRFVAVLDITPQSEGNATGIGMADITTRRVVDRIDWKATYLNSITAGTPRNGACPVVADTDREAIDLILAMLPENRMLRAIRIANTLKLGTFWATGAVVREIRDRPDIVVEPAPLRLRFDRAGRILPLQ